MRQARSVIVPSVFFEGLPTVILEAFAAGRPVVAAKIRSLEALVTPEVGWQASPRSGWDRSDSASMLARPDDRR